MSDDVRATPGASASSLGSAPGFSVPNAQRPVPTPGISRQRPTPDAQISAPDAQNLVFAEPTAPLLTLNSSSTHMAGRDLHTKDPRGGIPPVAMAPTDQPRPKPVTVPRGRGRSRSKSVARSKSRRKRKENQMAVKATTAAKAWADLFKVSSQPNSSTNLKFIPPVTNLDRRYAKIPKEVTSTNTARWTLSVVAYVVGARPDPMGLAGYLKWLWRLKGSLGVQPRGNGFFIFTFSSEEELMRVLTQGPSFVYGKPLIMKRWTPNSTFEHQRLTSIPIWVRFPQLPLKYWSKKAMEIIASLLGQPLFLDEATAQARRVDFARLCVEISYDFDFPESVWVMDEATGDMEEVQVTYDWRPTPCNHCHTFGHLPASCVAVLLDKGKQVAQSDRVSIPDTSPKSTIPQAAETGLATSNPFGVLETPAEESVSMIPQGVPAGYREENSHAQGVDQGRPEILVADVEDLTLAPTFMVARPQGLLTETAPLPGQQDRGDFDTVLSASEEESDTGSESALDRDTHPQGRHIGGRTIHTRGCDTQEQELRVSSARKTHVELKRLAPTTTTRARRKDQASPPKGASRPLPPRF